MPIDESDGDEGGDDEGSGGDAEEGGAEGGGGGGGGSSSPAAPAAAPADKSQSSGFIQTPVTVLSESVVTFPAVKTITSDWHVEITVNYDYTGPSCTRSRGH